MEEMLKAEATKKFLKSYRVGALKHIFYRGV
jgi:hypothetical protein